MTSMQTIVHKFPKQLVPDEYLKLVLQNSPTAFGFAGRENGKLLIECSPKSLMLSEVKELQNVFKNEHLVMFFMNAPDAVVPDDVQPWTISDGNVDDPTHHLAIFYEGDFARYAGKDGKHTPEYCVSDIEIFPKLQQAFIDAGQDQMKFVDVLRTQKFQDILSNYFDKRGVFLMLPPTGDPISFGKNDVGGSYPWGTVSNNHGYAEVGATKVIEEKKGGVLSFLRGKAMASAAPAEPPPTPAPAPSPKPDVKPTEPEKKEVAPKVTKTVDGVTLTQMFPPPKLRGNKKAINLWLRTFNGGKLPDDHESSTCCVWVPSELIPLAQTIVGSKEEVARLGTEVFKLKKPNVAKAEATAEAAREVLKSDDKPITAPQTPSSKSTVRQSASDYLPTLTDPDKEKAMNKMAGFLGKTKQPTALEIQKSESKWPTFSEAIGIKFEELLTRPVHELVELFDGDKIGTCAFIEMRRKYIEASGIKLDELGKTNLPQATKGEEKPTVQKTGTVGLSFLRGKSAA